MGYKGHDDNQCRSTRRPAIQRENSPAAKRWRSCDSPRAEGMSSGKTPTGRNTSDGFEAKPTKRMTKMTCALVTRDFPLRKAKRRKERQDTGGNGRIHSGLVPRYLEPKWIRISLSLYIYTYIYIDGKDGLWDYGMCAHAICFVVFNIGKW